MFPMILYNLPPMFPIILYNGMEFQMTYPEAKE
jgi:hypothetical protein